MTDPTMTTEALPVDTTTADAAKLRTMMNAATQSILNPEFEVPPSFDKLGYEKLPRAGGLFGILKAHYIYKPMRAWDDAQKFADELIERTGGGIFLFVSDILSDLAACAALKQGDDEDEATYQREIGETFLRMCNTRWQSFLGACPNLKPFELARRVIEKTDVRRLPHPSEADKPEAERDPGGRIFDATGPGRVETFYRGRRDQILRIGIAATWGSVGDFFVPG